MDKEEICKNCKYHYIEEISFDYPQSICNKDEKVGYTTEQGLSCDDFTYSKEYVKTQQQELERYKNIIEKAITFINIFQDEKTLTLNYNNLKHLRGILKGNDFDLIILEDKLKELKGE